jgi:hypothetical protein
MSTRDYKTLISIKITSWGKAEHVDRMRTSSNAYRISQGNLWKNGYLEDRGDGRITLR